MNRNPSYQTHYYQKNKEKKKQQRKERYQQQKQQAELSAKQQSAKYYRAEAIKILMSFKEYTELSKDKHKLWLDFNWTLQDCSEDIKEGLGNVVAIMKLREVTDNLIRDYWAMAKREISKGKTWSSLDYDEQQKLIKYWGYEKTRVENDYIDEAERLEKQSQAYLKEIERVKFHEERGKIKCPCYDCETKKEIQAEVRAERKKKIADYEQEQKASEGKAILVEGECANCGEYKKVDEETRLCKKCGKESC